MDCEEKLFEDWKEYGAIDGFGKVAQYEATLLYVPFASGAQPGRIRDVYLFFAFASCSQGTFRNRGNFFLAHESRQLWILEDPKADHDVMVERAKKEAGRLKRDFENRLRDEGILWLERAVTNG